MIKNLLLCATISLIGCASVTPAPVTPAPAAAAPVAEAIKRAPLQKADYLEASVVHMMLVTIVPYATVGRHTHPGVETSYVLEGQLELEIDGQSPAMFKAGSSYMVPTGVPHGGKVGPNGARILSVYVVDKTKPLASPAP